MENKSIEKMAWDSFSKTGKIGYYLFYRALQRMDENDGAGGKGNRNSEDEI